jgi:hypothetical protein
MNSTIEIVIVARILKNPALNKMIFVIFLPVFTKVEATGLTE